MNVRMQLLPVAAVLLCAQITAPVFAKPREMTPRTGTAVYYSDKMEGKTVSLKGEKYHKDALTAATHGYYPLGGTLKVTNLSNQKSVTVKINDRMNPRSKATIDLSRKAAEEIDMIHSGHAKVRIELVEAK